jgi:hypothetical protein
VKKHPTPSQSQQFLSGWKEIAGYLGKGVRTAQRYERLLALPVRRPAGKPSGSVIATKAELDGWVKASPIREIFHLRNRPDSESQTNALKNRVSEMAQLREQLLTLRYEVQRSVDSLHSSICELQNILSPSMRDSSLYRGNEKHSLERSGWETKVHSSKYLKAS